MAQKILELKPNKPELLPRKRRPKLAGRGLAIAALVFILLNLLIGLFEPYFMGVARYDKQYNLTRLVDYYNAPRPEIMFMGSSRVLSGLNPVVAAQELEQAGLGKRAILNLAVTGSSIDLNYLILKNIIKDDKKPAMIVYGITETEFNSGRAMFDYDEYFALAERLDDFGNYSGDNLTKKVSFVLKQLLPLYRDHDILRLAFNIQFNPGDAYHKSYLSGPQQWKPDPGGYFSYYPTGVYLPPDARIKPLLQNYQYQGYRLDRLHDFLKLAKARDIKVLLVNMPVLPATIAMWPGPAELATYYKFLQEQARQFELPYLDLYQGEKFLTEADFWDSSHLNEQGAEKLTRLVTRQLLLEQLKP